MSEQLRSITIKTGIVRRLAKELNMYRDEEKKEKEKVQKMKESGADPYDIKYAVGAESIMNESSAMVPDTEQRLKVAIKDLTSCLEENQSLEKTDEFQAATEILENATSIQ
ncbi:Tubulin-specific chaperone A [Picochlorum sp. SENEW3]|nr:Tubulin-specific chaperone A [Picochlorum sp. SENEW3]